MSGTEDGMVGDDGRITGSFVWYGGYLFLKPETGSVEDLTILSIEPGIVDCHGAIQTEVLDISCVYVDHIPFLPPDLKGKGYMAPYKMRPRSLAIPLNFNLERLLESVAMTVARALQPRAGSVPQSESHGEEG